MAGQQRRGQWTKKLEGLREIYDCIDEVEATERISQMHHIKNWRGLSQASRCVIQARIISDQNELFCLGNVWIWGYAWSQKIPLSFCASILALFSEITLSLANKPKEYRKCREIKSFLLFVSLYHVMSFRPRSVVEVSPRWGQQTEGGHGGCKARSAGCAMHSTLRIASISGNLVSW